MLERAVADDRGGGATVSRFPYRPPRRSPPNSTGSVRDAQARRAWPRSRPQRPRGPRSFTRSPTHRGFLDPELAAVPLHAAVTLEGSDYARSDVAVALIPGERRTSRSRRS